jgi:hypothetical protein
MGKNLMVAGVFAVVAWATYRMMTRAAVAKVYGTKAFSEQTGMLADQERGLTWGAWSPLPTQGGD